jgi:hypothetical protein
MGLWAAGVSIETLIREVAGEAQTRAIEKELMCIGRMGDATGCIAYAG